MTYLVVVHKPVPRSKRPPQHFSVDELHKRFDFNNGAKAIAVTKKTDIKKALSTMIPPESEKLYGKAAYVVRGDTAYLIMYMLPGGDVYQHA